MKKSTKGALAAGAAAALLLGGAGSLAYWTDDSTVAGGALTSGSMTLTDITCGDWAYGGADAGTPATPVTAIVPGDEVVKRCTGTLTLVGDHIAATVATSSATWTDPANPLAAKLQVSATQTAPTAPLTSTGSVAFTIDVKFPYGGPVSTPDPGTGADNSTQAQTAALDDIEVVAVQAHAGAGVTP
jgi:alternate signal-mediated exported protein